MKLSKTKIRKLIYLFVYEFCISLFAIFLKTNAVGYLVLSWGIPSVLLLYKLPTFRIRYIKSAFLFCIPASIIIDSLGHKTQAWSFWTNPLFASSGINVMGIPIESFVWSFLFWLFNLVLYVYFFDKHRTHKIPKKEYLFASFFTILGLLLIFFINEHKLEWLKFYYLLLNTIAIIAFIVVARRNSILGKRILLFCTLTFFLGLIFEFTSLTLDLWSFPSKNFLWVFYFFNHKLPIEEILWWFTAASVVVIFYEFLNDTED